MKAAEIHLNRYKHDRPVFLADIPHWITDLLQLLPVHSHVCPLSDALGTGIISSSYCPVLGTARSSPLPWLRWNHSNHDYKPRKAAGSNVCIRVCSVLGKVSGGQEEKRGYLVVLVVDPKSFPEVPEHQWTILLEFKATGQVFPRARQRRDLCAVISL